VDIRSQRPHRALKRKKAPGTAEDLFKHPFP
jgi:hypothetical protein